MKDYDNPAGRLYRVISSAPSEAFAKMAAREVWSRLLEVKDPENNVEIYRGIGMLLDQIDKAEGILRSIPNIDHQLYLHSFAAIRQGLATPSLAAAWSGPQRFLTDAAMRDVAFCAAKISEVYSEGHVEKAELAELAKDLDDIVARIAAASINRDLRQILLDLLEAVRRAMAEYRIRGSAGLREETARSIGFFMLALQRASDDEEKATVSKVADFLKKLDALVGHAMKYKPLFAAIGRKLLPGVSEVDDIHQ